MNPKMIGEKVKKLMEQNNITKKELANKLDIREKELDKKLSGKKEFLASEAASILDIFELTIQEFASIFFNSEISENKGKIKQ